MISAAIFGFCLWSILESFAWLLLETNFLRVRLPCGAAIGTLPAIETPFVVEVIETPEPAKREYVNPCANLLPEKCYVTRVQETMGKYATDSMHGSGYARNVLDKTSYQQFTIGNQTITLNATLPNLYELWADVVKAQTVKQSGGFAQAPCNQIPMFIERVRTGCEKVQHGTRGGRRYYEYDDTYNTVYRECLVSADWLKEHEHDLDDYQPGIDISCNGQSLVFTPDNKHGDITKYMGKFTQRVKVGKRMETVFEGFQIVDCGGGVKIVTYPQTELPDAIDKAIDNLAQERVTAKFLIGGQSGN